MSRALTEKNLYYYFTPITLRNYAGTCASAPPREISETEIEDTDMTDRRSSILKNAIPFLDSKKKKYLRLLDGGIADNIGLRAITDRVMLRESVGKYIEGTPLENVRKFVFVIVNAQTEPNSLWDRMETIPPFVAMIDSSATVAIHRYNVETLALLKESIRGWSDQVRVQRCSKDQPMKDRTCEDIQFYVIYVGFEALKDEKEREYFNKIPTSFQLESEEVDNLRAAAKKILRQSKEFERLIKDLDNH